MTDVLPPLTAYSRADWEKLFQLSPVAKHYYNLLQSDAVTPSNILRKKRHEAWLQAVMATFIGNSSPQAVCSFWSIFTTQYLQEAWQKAHLDSQPLALLALGKLGAGELNLSSDVDLILVSVDQATVDLKCVQDFQKLVAEVTDFGFGYRLDLNLRPGGRLATLIPTYSEFENHYGYHGEMWERLAYVRLSVLAGPLRLVEQIQNFARQFSYRRHLDYTVLDELRALRTRIHSESAPKNQNDFHLKLSRGGIRDIELYVHSLQIMHGGRNTLLQQSSTTLALEQIAQAQLLPAADVETLRNAYWHYRDLENRLQGQQDLQSYTVPRTKALEQMAQKIDGLVSSLLKIEEAEALTLPLAEDQQQTWLQSIGLSPTSQQEVWPQLIAATALSRKSERDEAARRQFLYRFIEDLRIADMDKDLGLSLLLDFIKATRAKATFFTLLNREPRLIQDLARLFSTSPYLGGLLSLRPELIDSFVLQVDDTVYADLESALDRLTERRLLSELVAANRFLEEQNLEHLTRNLSEAADQICLTLLRLIQRENSADPLQIIAMGKWGGRELGLRSDLDFIFMSSHSQSHSPNDAKLAKRFLSHISATHKGGIIYPVDMRLRPSGHAGPLLTTQGDLQDYLQTKAAAWERQSYLRARSLTPNAVNPATWAVHRPLSAEDQAELLNIRQQLFKDVGQDELDLKLNHGGLSSVEFTVQITLLKRQEFSLDPSTRGMIQYLADRDEVWRKQSSALWRNYEKLRIWEQLYQLTTLQSGSRMRIKSDSFQRLARLCQMSAEDLQQEIRNTLAKNQALLVLLDPLIV